MTNVVRELAIRLQMSTDKASFASAQSAVAKVRDSVSSLTPSAGKVASSIGALAGRVAGLAVAALGIRGLADEFIGLNAKAESTRISLDAMHRMLSGGRWEASAGFPVAVLEQYKKSAAAIGVSASDMLAIHRDVIGAASVAGATLGDVQDIVRGAVIASRVFGESSEGVARNVSMALTRGVEMRDKLMVTLLASQKLTVEQFNAMSKADKVATLKRIFTQGPLQIAAEELSDSWEGLKESVVSLTRGRLREIGEPLFLAAKDFLRGLKELMSDNNAELREWVAGAKSAVAVIVELGKGFGQVTGLAWGVVRGPLKGILGAVSELEDWQAYVSGKKVITRRGLEQAEREGPEALRRYIQEYGGVRKTGYEQTPEGFAGTLVEGGRWIGKMGADIVSWWRGGGVPTDTDRQRVAMFSDWRERFKAEHGRAPTAEEYAAWRNISVRATPELWSGIQTGPLMSAPVPEVPYSGAPAVQLGGRVHIAVKVDVPSAEAHALKAIEAQWSEGAELMSVVPE